MVEDVDTTREFLGVLCTIYCFGARGSTVYSPADSIAAGGRMPRCCMQQGEGDFGIDGNIWYVPNALACLLGFSYFWLPALFSAAVCTVVLVGSRRIHIIQMCGD